MLLTSASNLASGVNVPSEAAANVTCTSPSFIVFAGASKLTLSRSNRPVAFNALRYKPHAISTNTNQNEVPDRLETVFVEMACGLYLKALKATGQLDLESVNFDAPAKTIKEGDVQVTFAAASDGTLTPEARFDALVNSMIHPPSHVFTRFRRLVW